MFGADTIKICTNLQYNIWEWNFKNPIRTEEKKKSTCKSGIQWNFKICNMPILLWKFNRFATQWVASKSCACKGTWVLLQIWVEIHGKINTGHQGNFIFKAFKKTLIILYFKPLLDNYVNTFLRHDIPLNWCHDSL